MDYEKGSGRLMDYPFCRGVSGRTLDMQVSTYLNVPSLSAPPRSIEVRALWPPVVAESWRT